MNMLSNKISIIRAVASRVMYVIVNVPTLSHAEEQLDDLYDDICKALDEDPTYYTNISGDFNAKIGLTISEIRNCTGLLWYPMQKRTRIESTPLLITMYVPNEHLLLQQKLHR